MASHPLGVRPIGNGLTMSTTLRSSMGHLSRLPDELFHTCLEWLDPKSLINLGHTCRALFAFTANDELWRTLSTK